MENEIWKDIIIDGETTLYQVSNLGKVKSLEKSFLQWNRFQHVRRFQKEMILSLCNDKDGYKLVGINNKSKRVHRLIAEAFIPNPENKKQVNHINGIKYDNRVENLEWVTSYENCQHAYDVNLNLGPREGVNGNSKYSREDVDKLLQYIKENPNETQKNISIILGVGVGWVNAVLIGKIWSHYTGFPYRGRIKKFQGMIIKEEDKMVGLEKRKDK